MRKYINKHELDITSYVKDSENEKNITFTKENFDQLKLTCSKIILLSNENVDGNLMMSQLIMLGENIKEFVDNPIVKNSGIIEKRIINSIYGKYV